MTKSDEEKAAELEAKQKAAEEKKGKTDTGKIHEATGLKWVKVTDDELHKAQKEGKLVGHRPHTQEALIK